MAAKKPIGKPASYRLSKWDRKYDPERVKAIIEQAKPEMLAHAKQKFNELYQLETSAKALLNHYPVSVCHVPSFLCFAREMWKAKQKYEAVLLARETVVKIDKWDSRGLDRTILEKLAFGLFGVILPDQE